MIQIPPHILQQLVALGIRQPQQCTWKRHGPTARPWIVLYRPCPCGARVACRDRCLGRRRMMLGQCDACGCVNWCEIVPD